MTPEDKFQAAFDAVGEMAKNQTAWSIFQSMQPVSRAPRPSAASRTHTPSATEDEVYQAHLHRFRTQSMAYLRDYILTSGVPYLAEAKRIYLERLGTGELPTQISRPIPCDLEQPGETEHQNKFC